MRKLIAAINMTLDGFCDHTSIAPNEEILYHYASLLNSASLILYGRVTYQLMEYWPTVLKNPTGNKAMDEFASSIDNIPKIVFSRTLTYLEWPSAKVAQQDLEKEVAALKLQPGKPILVGSPGLIVSLMNLKLIDECQLCIHPVIAAQGLPLFKDIHNRTELKLLKTRTFASGAQLLYYEPKK